jgi:Na+-translocating ferredoxin:NAD+ oxidoreductase RnfG subunit
MNISLSQVLITLFAASISGLLTAQINSRRSKKEKVERAAEKAHDQLLLEIKDLQIKLYKLEKDLTEWKEKYFEALQELIKVKSELEGTMLRLSHIEMHDEALDDI